MSDLTPSEISPDRLPAAFTRAVGRARTALFWERLWPRVVPPLSVTALFLSASWAGVWGMAHPYGRMAGVLAFTLALAASPWRFKTGSLAVSRDEALKRLDHNLGDPVNPAQKLGDRPSSGSSVQEKELWNLQMSNLWARWGDKFEAGTPKPGMAARDPYHLRFFIALTMAISAATSSGPRLEQIKQAFDWTLPAPPAPAKAPLQVRAWVTPPDNIPKAPLQMTEATRDDTQGGEKLEAHQTSTLTIMTYGSATNITVNGQPLAVQKEIPQGEGKTGYQYEVKLQDAQTIVAIERGPTWHISIVQDNAPVVTLQGITTPTTPGPAGPKDSKGIDIDYRAKDDYGYQGEIIVKMPGKPDPAAKPLPSAQVPVFTLP